MKSNKIKKILVAALTTVAAISISTQTLYRNSELKAIDNRLTKIEYKLDQQAEIKSNELMSTLDVMQEYKQTEVIYSNFGTWDEYESADITASGLSSKDFTVNSYGMYEYEGLVVIATANTTRLDKGLFTNYKSHELYEVITIHIDEFDRSFDAIVLDVCGACYGVSNEFNQRYDIYTTFNIFGSKGLGSGVIISEQ